MDSARPRAALERSRSARRARRRGRHPHLRDRGGSRHADHRAVRPGRGGSRLRVLGPPRGQGPRRGAAVLVPVHPRRRAEPDRPHLDWARASHPLAAAPVRVRVLRQLRARVLLRLPPSGRRRAGSRALPRRLHLRVRGPSPSDGPAPQRQRRGSDAADLSQPVRAVPHGSRSPAAPRRGAGARDVGRPRGPERLRLGVVGDVRRSGELPCAADRSLPGLLRAHAAQAEPLTARGRGAPAVRPVPLRGPGGVLDARRATVPVARGLHARARLRRRPLRDRRLVPGAPGARPLPPRHRPGSLAVRRPRARVGALERPRPGRPHGATPPARSARGHPRVLDRTPGTGTP